MSSVEIFVIVGGLIFGYIAVSVAINQNHNIPSETSESNGHSNSSQKKSENESNSYQNTAEEKHISTNWFKILEIPESAQMSDITHQYKRKIREYHPDKVATLGRELRELAELKSQEINIAFEYAKKIK